MKEKLFVAITAIIVALSVVLNIAVMVDKPVSLFNRIISVLSIIMFAAFIYRFRSSRRIMSACAIYWTCTVICAVMTVVNISTGLELNALWLVVLVALSPYYGICAGIIENARVSYEILIVVIPLAFSVFSSYFVLGGKARSGSAKTFKK